MEWAPGHTRAAVLSHWCQWLWGQLHWQPHHQSSIADQDDGTYTCTVIVTGGSNVLQATASDDITITVNGEKILVTSFPTQQDCETD